MIKEIEKIFNKAQKLVDKYNEKVDLLTKRFGTDEIYLDKSGSNVSGLEKAYKMKVLSRNEKQMIIEEEPNYRQTLTAEYDEEYNEWWVRGFNDGVDGLVPDIKWANRCLNNGIKWFESENPDAFLEKDDEDED